MNQVQKYKYLKYIISNNLHIWQIQTISVIPVDLKQENDLDSETNNFYFLLYNVFYDLFQLESDVGTIKCFLYLPSSSKKASLIYSIIDRNWFCLF